MDRYRLWFVWTFVVFSCGEGARQGEESPRSGEQVVLEEKLAAYYADMTARDWRKYRTHFWDSATLTTAWQSSGDSAARVHVITIDEFIRLTPQGPDSQPVFAERMKSASIQVKNNLATAWVEYDAEFGKPDSLARWSGTDLFTFMKHAGEWKIVSLVFEAEL